MNLLTQFTDQYICVSQKKESQHEATCKWEDDNRIIIVLGWLIHKTNMLESQIKYTSSNQMLCILTGRAYVMYVFSHPVIFKCNTE